MRFKRKMGLMALMVLGLGSAAQAGTQQSADEDSVCGRAIGDFWEAESAAAYQAVRSRSASISGNFERDDRLYFQPGDSGLPDVNFLDRTSPRNKDLRRLYASGYETINGMWLIVVPNEEGAGYRGQVFVSGVSRGKPACVKAYATTQRIGVKELPEGYWDQR